MTKKNREKNPGTTIAKNVFRLGICNENFRTTPTLPVTYATNNLPTRKETCSQSRTDVLQLTKRGGSRRIAMRFGVTVNQQAFMHSDEIVTFAGNIDE